MADCGVGRGGPVVVPAALVFVGGLHRSGTSLVHRWLAAHPDVTGFSGTGVPEDEGQHLQTVFLPDYRFGGAGRFAFGAAAHLTEHSTLLSPENRARLASEWGRYWRPGAPVGVEKSPTNLVRARFLQAFFPEAVFVMVLRHPIAVAGATRKGRRRLLSYEALVHHWVVAHTILACDAARIRNLHVIRYEHLVADPQASLAPVFAAVGLHPPPTPPSQPNLNREYFDQWQARTPHRRRDRRRTITRWEPIVRHFGYSLTDLHRCDDTPLSTPTAIDPDVTHQPRPPAAYTLASTTLRLARACGLQTRSNTVPARRRAS
jgi:sulfotransferase family protein